MFEKNWKKRGRVMRCKLCFLYPPQAPLKIFWIAFSASSTAESICVSSVSSSSPSLRSSAVKFEGHLGILPLLAGEFSGDTAFFRRCRARRADHWATATNISSGKRPSLSPAFRCLFPDADEGSATSILMSIPIRIVFVGVASLGLSCCGGCPNRLLGDSGGTCSFVFCSRRYCVSSFFP